MNYKLSGILGLAITATFIIGIVGLTIYNPPILFSLTKDLSLFWLNIDDMRGQLWAAYFIYGMVGSLSVAFGISLFKAPSSSSMLTFGRLLLILSGVLWISMGFTPIIPQSEIGTEMKIYAARGVLLFLTCPFSLIIIGAEIRYITKDSILEYYSIASGLFIFIFPFLMAAIFDKDKTFTRDTNAVYLIYYFWFGFFGLRLLIKNLPAEDA